MQRKHIILVHGRDTKPRMPEMERLLKSALCHGLRRVDPRSSEQVESGEIRFTLAYYGDVNNRIMVEEDPDRTDEMVKVEGLWYEPDGVFDAPLERLFSRSNDAHGEDDYLRLIETERNTRFRDDVLRIASPLLSVIGLGKRIVGELFPDLRAYLHSRATAAEIQQRLIAPLGQALAGGDDVALIAHSMGSMVAYDVLWRMSRTVEFESVHERDVSLLLTMGSPLGDDSVRAHLWDANEPDDGRYPSNVEMWANVSAKDDFIAHEPSLRPDFAHLVKSGCIGAMVDLPMIYNFYVGRDGSNPHKSYGYLDNPSVARIIAAWVWR